MLGHRLQPFPTLTLSLNMPSIEPTSGVDVIQDVSCNASTAED